MYPTIWTKRQDPLDYTLATELGRTFAQSEVLPELLRWLILIASQKKNTEYLSQFFDLDFLFTGKTYNDALVFHLVTTLGVQLRHDPDLREILWQTYARHPLGQSYYFELFVDIDYLVMHHHKGLVIYSRHKKTAEARLFVNCLLFLKGFLTGDKTACESAYHIIRNIEPDLSIHPTPLGRRFACMLLYEHHYGAGIKKNLIYELFEVAANIPKSGPLGQHLPTFHTLVAEALNWCAQYNIAHEVLQKAIKEYGTDETFVGVSFHHQMLVSLATTQLRRGETEQAKATFRKIKPYLFDVHSRQYNLMGYYLLKSLLLKMTGDAAKANIAYTNAKEIAYRLKFQGILENILPTYLK